MLLNIESVPYVLLAISIAELIIGRPLAGLIDGPLSLLLNRKSQSDMSNP